MIRGINSEITPLKRLTFRGKPTELVVPHTQSNKSFLDVLENRSSSYEFEEFSAQQLANVLYFSSRTKKTSLNKWGQTIEYRNVASPGAMHSIYCFVKAPNNISWFCYDNQLHALNEQEVAPDISFESECRSLVENPNNSWLIWYVCDLDLLSSKYQNPLPLAYRECGGIAATQHLVCEALGYNFTQLGIRGANQAQIFSNERQLFGLGTALIAGRSPT